MWRSLIIGENLPKLARIFRILTAKNLRVDMEAGRFIEGMVEGIVGMKPEEVKEMTLTFPEDYPKEDVAGKSGNFYHYDERVKSQGITRA
jgi:hypothetical protein